MFEMQTGKVSEGVLGEKANVQRVRKKAVVCTKAKTDNSARNLSIQEFGTGHEPHEKGGYILPWTAGLPITCFVEGLPIAQPRVKGAVRGKFARFYTPQKKIRPWKSSVSKELKQVMHDRGVTEAYDGGLTLKLDFVFPRPKYHYTTSRLKLTQSAPQRMIVKPDFDNLAKAIADVTTDVGLIVDDCQYDYCVILKRYVEGLELPGVYISIEK